MMRVTVLGSGTCTPHLKRLPAGYWVEIDGGVNLRLDAGAGTLYAAERLGLNWEALTHQFISHFHIDHVLDLPMLLFALKYGRQPLPRQPLHIIGPAGLCALMEKLQAALQPGLLNVGVAVGWHELAPGMSLALADGVTLRVAKTPHTPESLAARIDTPDGALGYTGDTAREPALFEFFRGVDTLIAECSFLDDLRHTPHLLAADAAELAAQADARVLITTHCYFDPDREQKSLTRRVAEYFHGIHHIAADGLKLSIGKNRR